MSDLTAIRKGEHYYKLHPDGRILTEQAEADLTFEDISLMSQAMSLTLPGQGYPSADAAMRAGICVRDLHAPSADLDVDDMFNLDEMIRIRHALRDCPPHQREAVIDELRGWRLQATILKTILDGLVDIRGLDDSGDIVMGLAGVGQPKAA